MTTQATAAALLLLALSTCAPREQLTPDQRACRSIALDDPAVKLLLNKAEGNTNFAYAGQDQIAAAKQDAYLACMRSRGVIPRGGVERQKP